MNTSQEYLIETRGLSKTYKGANTLQLFDLRVKQNTICGFLGPNGAGKSTISHHRQIDMGHALYGLRTVAFQTGRAF